MATQTASPTMQPRFDDSAGTPATNKDEKANYDYHGVMGTAGAPSSGQNGSAQADAGQSFPYAPLPPQGARDPLDEWAPTSPPFEQLPASGMPHLPKASGVKMLGGEKRKVEKGITSKPLNIPLTPLQASISYSLARLLSYPRFQAFLLTPLGFAQFHNYLTSTSPGGQSVRQLELFKDCRVLGQLLRQGSLAAKGINDVYLEEDATSRVDDMPRPVLKDLVVGLRAAAVGAPGLDTPSKHLLQALYAAEFENFVRHRLLKHTKAQLSRYHLAAEDRAGIGSAFLLTNPRLPDDPIVLVSPGFCELTGYSAQQIIGRNCRFLQGKASSPASVNAIRKRLERGEEVTQVVVNYRASGEPFINMVNIIPLRDLSGSLTYFIGGQTDLTRALTRGSDLSFILPEDEDLAVDMTAFSPAVQVEAREAQHTSTDGGPDLAIIDLPPTPPSEAAPQPAGTGGVAQGPTQGQKRERDIGLRQLLSLKRSVMAMCSKKKDAAQPLPVSNGETHPERRPLLAPTQQDPTVMPLEKRMLDVQNTYEKLIIVKREGAEILFTTAGFLRFVGLPGTSRQQIDRSPLVHRSLLDLIVAPEAPTPASVPTKELRNKIKSGITQAVAMSTPCALSLRLESPSGGKVKTTPTVVGRIFLAPLLNLFSESSATTVVFG
ncbi:hypothetical protein JCM10213_003732 [Rhodosporidiobolus nylandii]